MNNEPNIRIVTAIEPAAPDPAADSEASPSPIFRKAALEHAHRRLEGSVLLAQSVSMNALIWSVLGIITIAVAFLATFQYATYERVTGVLRNSGGDLKVFPATTAVIEKLFVSSGDLVTEGQPLAILRSEENAERGRSAKELQRKELAQQIANLQENRTRETRESEFEREKLAVSLENARQRLTALDRQIQLSTEQLNIDRSILAARTKMNKAGHVSTLDVETSKASALRTEERLQQLRTDRAETAGTIARVQTDIASLPERLEQTIAGIDNEISSLQRQLIPLDSQIEQTLRARQAGRVANIVAFEGEVVQPQFPLMSLTTPDAELIAELYVPSRSRAFIRVGQEVHVRFESFPSEHYGDMPAEVVEVSEVMLFPDEWPNPMKIPKPVYKVLVRLQRQYMTVEGAKVQLQQGIPVDADIILERRTMLGHLLAPILKVKDGIH